MSALKATPGPWSCTTRRGSWDWVVYSEADPNIEICQMFHDGTDLNESGEANARLAAAAPELCEALNNALATLKAIYQWLDKVNDAGGATSINGVAACNAMLKSLNGNRDRFQKLIVDSGNAALAKARGEEVGNG